MSTARKPSQQSWLQYMKRPKRGVPEGLWLRCDGCSATVFRNQVEENLNICPERDHSAASPPPGGELICTNAMRNSCKVASRI